MSFTSLFDKVTELKDAIRRFFTSKKKLTALTNYAHVVPIKHKSYLTLIKKCADDGFLGDKETDFLSYMVDYYDINFLDWAHKTKWLKGEMARIAKAHKKEPYRSHPMFDLEPKQHPVVHVPMFVPDSEPLRQQPVRRV